MVRFRLWGFQQMTSVPELILRDVPEPDNPDYPLPQYCFLEPTFRGPAEDDQHPPADVMNGELLIAKVYNAVRASDIWNKCLLVVNPRGPVWATRSRIETWPTGHRSALRHRPG